MKSYTLSADTKFFVFQVTRFFRFASRGVAERRAKRRRSRYEGKLLSEKGNSR